MLYISVVYLTLLKAGRRQEEEGEEAKTALPCHVTNAVHRVATQRVCALFSDSSPDCHPKHPLSSNPKLKKKS